MHTKRVLLLAGYSMTALQLSSSYYTIEVDSMMPTLARRCQSAAAMETYLETLFTKLFLM